MGYPRTSVLYCHGSALRLPTGRAPVTGFCSQNPIVLSLQNVLCAMPHNKNGRHPYHRMVPTVVWVYAARGANEEARTLDLLFTKQLY